MASSTPCRINYYPTLLKHTHCGAICPYKCYNLLSTIIACIFFFLSLVTKITVNVGKFSVEGKVEYKFDIKPQNLRAYSKLEKSTLIHFILFYFVNSFYYSFILCWKAKLFLFFFASTILDYQQRGSWRAHKANAEHG